MHPCSLHLYIYVLQLTNITVYVYRYTFMCNQALLNVVVYLYTGANCKVVFLSSPLAQSSINGCSLHPYIGVLQLTKLVVVIYSHTSTCNEAVLMYL